MHVADLIEIALANSDSRRVNVVTVEPADLAVETVGALSQLIAELVENAIAFSEAGDEVRVTGIFDHGSYLITVSDRGIGLPEHLMNALNRVLADPSRVHEASGGPGVAVIARLAARHGIRVRLVPGMPGTTARVTIPSRLVTPMDEPAEPEAERIEIHPRTTPARQVAAMLQEKAEEEFGRSLADEGHHHGITSLATPSTAGVVGWSDEARHVTEEFLDKVFAPLVAQPGMTERPPSHPGSNGRVPGREPVPVRPEPSAPRGGGATVTALRRRVPGENYSPVEDEPSTMAAEQAVDIRSALSRYSEGRASAERARQSSRDALDDRVTPAG